jgi:hypothetical protein
MTTMHGSLTYRIGQARIDDLHREAAKASRIANRERQPRRSLRWAAPRPAGAATPTGMSPPHNPDRPGRDVCDGVPGGCAATPEG